jgi:zinc-binding alcohol dehydrogenase family protein
VAVNRIDTKLRRFAPVNGPHRVLGFDVAGVVHETGSDATMYAVGDEVFYAGSVARPGANSEYHLADERLVARKPAALSFAEAAALPLTSITAWEALYERLRIGPTTNGTILIVGAAGGVGSMAVQLARRTPVTVLATASRPESRLRVTELGAHHVIDPASLEQEVAEYAADGVDFIVSPFSSGRIDSYARIIRPHGAIVGLDDPDPPSLAALKPKSVTWHWESMFTRPLFGADPINHHYILTAVAELADRGQLATSVHTVLTPFSAETLTEAHRLMEQGSVIGKVVISLGD